jgi:AcrR family transcriptional regulator
MINPMREPGLRELNKLEKRQRIRSAARELFSERGYDDATLRQIARRAHVGLGTLFQYARDKRDLIFLIFNEELAAVTVEALRAPQPDHCLLEQLMAVFATHFYFFSKEPALSRILLRELVFYSNGVHAAEFLRIRTQLMEGLAAIVRAAQGRRAIRRGADPDLVARIIFFVFSGYIRLWIAGPSPHPFAGLTELRRQLELLIRGLTPDRR